MNFPRIRVLSGLLCLPLLACAADSSDTTSGTTSTATSAGTTSETTDDDTGLASSSDTGSSAAGTTAEPTTGTSTSDTTDGTATTGTTGAVGTTGDATTSTGTTGDSTSTGEPAGLSWEMDVYPVIVAPNCGCHAKDGAGGLTMTNATDSYAILVDVPSWQSDFKRVEPGDPAKSYLFHKLNGTQDKFGSGFQMPLGVAPMPKEQVDLVAQWISEGALP